MHKNVNFVELSGVWAALVSLDDLNVSEKLLCATIKKSHIGFMSARD